MTLLEHTAQSGPVNVSKFVVFANKLYGHTPLVRIQIRYSVFACWNEVILIE